MNRWLIFTCVAAVAAPLACSVNTSLFVGGDSGAGGSSSAGTAQGGTSQGTSASQGTSTSATGGSGGAGSATVTSSQTGSTVASSTGSGMTNCAHDICDEGAGLMSGCDPCVTQICNADPFCCQQTWDIQCTFDVQAICQIDCAPNVISCEDQYNAHPAVNFTCNQSGRACDLNASILTQSCSTICAARGGECLGAANDVQQCGHGQELTCDTVGFQAVVCTCSRGCGGGQPCGNGQTCVNGSCI